MRAMVVQTMLQTALQTALRAALVTAATLIAVPAAAQRPVTPAPRSSPPKVEPKPGPATPERPPEEPPPPYEREMIRLSEIMGSLAYLRTLCNAPDQGEWRAKMTALLDAEATTSTRKARLAGAYNKGFRGYALTYRTCTPSASFAIDRYLAEGKILARAISGRFGG